MLGLQSGPSVDTLTALAKKGDIAGLSKYAAGNGSEFRVFKGGAYQVGSMGWTAKDLSYPGIGDFVVFTTPLTSEDIGELLFKRVGDKLQLIEEEAKDGLRIKFQSLKVSFDIPNKTTTIHDDIDVEITPNDKPFHLLRFSPCYQVSKITQGGKNVAFKQVGGVVMLPKQAPGQAKFSLDYTGYVNLPNYAGSIGPTLATLTNDYWYPMANRMPCAYHIQVVPPSPDWTVVAQGNRVSNTNGVESFQMDLPTVYWSLTVLKTDHYAEKIDGRTLQMWSPRVSQELMSLQPKLYAPIIKLYNEKFSPFPFDSYGALDSPVYGGGALEAYSYATYGGGLPDEDAHEPSHTWWGGILPNTYLKSFWNESFADWSQGFYAREVPIGNTQERRKMFQTVSMPEPDYNEASLMKSGVAIGAAAGSLGYGKGALVLAMLEQLVGTDNLLSCIQEWIRTHPKGEPAEWEQFESVVLRKLPEFKLQDFFNDWFRRPGYATIDLDRGTIIGTRANLHFTWSGPKFRMPLDLWFDDGKGNRKRVQIDTRDISSSGDLSVDVKQAGITKVYMDPYHRALRSGGDVRTGSVGETLGSLRIVRDTQRHEYLTQFGRATSSDITDVNGKMLIGHPSTMPTLTALCKKVGFIVDGNKLTYDGTTIDLTKGAAIAIVELGGGKRCGIALGTTKLRPNLGMASVGLVDELGRALRGKVNFPLNASAISLK